MSVGSILPAVSYADPAEAAARLCSAFGFSIYHVMPRPDGGTAHIVLRFGENTVVVAPHGSSAFDDLRVQPTDAGSRRTQASYLAVQGVDQHCAHALRAGARVEIEPCDDGVGGRFYACCDPEGYLWSFGDPLAGQTLPCPDCPSDRPRRYIALRGRAAFGLSVLAVVAVGGMLDLGTGSAARALTAGNGGITRPNALSVQIEQGTRASTTKRFELSEAAVLDPMEVQISQFEIAEAPQLKRDAEKPRNASDAEYQSRLKDDRDALDAAVRAKELASRELEAERRRVQAIQTLLDEASQQLARLRADWSKFEAEYQSRLKVSQGALDAAVRAEELASRELEAERHRTQVIQTQLEEASRQLARLRADGSKFEIETRQLRDGMAQLGDAAPSSMQAGETARDPLPTAESTEHALREQLRVSERESRELELRARMTILEMDKEAARLRAEQAAESARTALSAVRANQSRSRDKLRAGEPGTTDATGRATASEPAGGRAKGLSEPATEVARNAPPVSKVDEGTHRAPRRASYVRPLPQHQITQSKKWISTAAIEKATAERRRQAAEAAAARKAEEERQRVAAEAARKAEAERQRQVAEAAAAARKAEEERQRLVAEAARKAEAERQRQVAEAAEAARIAKEAVEAKARADRETRRRTLGLTVTSEDGERFLARGRALLKTGDVTSARLFLERASNAGLADAAIELAETYDPMTVTRLNAVGLVGDREQARAWYMRAQTLGSSAAAERLKSIVGQ